MIARFLYVIKDIITYYGEIANPVRRRSGLRALNRLL
jgi:hypothetical protein